MRTFAAILMLGLFLAIAVAAAILLVTYAVAFWHDEITWGDWSGPLDDSWRLSHTGPLPGPTKEIHR